MTKVPSWGISFGWSATCSQTLVCLDVICKVPGIASGTYLVLGKPWLSSHHHHYHRYKAVRSSRTRQVVLKSWNFWVGKVSSADIRLREYYVDLLTNWMKTFLSTYSTLPPLKGMEKASETDLCPKTRWGINLKCCKLKSQYTGSIC